MHASPDYYGAFPTDPYSHTPGFNGVQQPGMTGQVKEDIITRFFELGLLVRDGQIAFSPVLLKREEFTGGPESWRHAQDTGVSEETIEAGSLAFTLCGVPVIYRIAEQARVKVISAEGATEDFEGNRLGQRQSRSLFLRDGKIRRIEVDVPANRRR